MKKQSSVNKVGLPRHAPLPSVPRNDSSQPWYTTPRTSYNEKRAIIIGGGLAGTSAAYSLAKRGWEITLIERGANLASGASGNPVGIISPMLAQKTDPIGQFYWHGFQHSKKHIHELGMAYNQCGILEVDREIQDINSNAVPCSELQELSREDVSLMCGVELSSGALQVKTGGFVSPEELCKNNILAFKDRIKIIPSLEITAIKQIGSGWAAINGNGAEAAAAQVCIIANAADAQKFSQTSHIPLQPVRGQVTFLPKCLNINNIICYGGGYIIPDLNGFHSVGATYDRDNLSCQISFIDNAENISNLRKIIDIGDVDAAKLQGRASLRAMVPDRRPVIGAAPDVEAFNEDYADLKHGRVKEYPQGKYLEGLYISTGHGSRGLVSCPLAGEILAAMIENEPVILPENIMNILSPARFIIKKLQGKGTSLR